MSGRLAFIGFMGSGKTTAARAAAAALGDRAVDADDEIEARAGKPIGTMFSDDGEAAFRALEEQVALDLLAREEVVSLGGGAVGSSRIREALRDRTVVWMDADPYTAWERVQGTGRPLARDRAEFERLHAEREPIYASLADVTIPAGRSARVLEAIAALEGIPPAVQVLWAASESGDYPAYVGSGLLGWWPHGIGGRRFIVTDGQVAMLYAGSISSAGSVKVMPGEQSKTIAHAEIVWTELVRAGMTRADVVVALGGGVVGDLAGFCAATYQRGVRYVQVPTTLVAQVDSAYGGKTGVDLPEAKNYVGAYHHPSAVIADTDTLKTLPAEELAAGYAEVLKTALIAGGWLWERIRGGAEATDPDLIAACARTKLRIVAHDERDAGVRQRLNLGHTVAHALEAVTGYARYRHGEAVALGLLAALRLSGQAELRSEVAALLSANGLPTKLDGTDPQAIVQATRVDKKRVGEGPVPFVLLERPGAPKTGCAVPESELLAAVKELASG
jgi:shikimate kinase/3-dehydroquinate synthase